MDEIGLHEPICDICNLVNHGQNKEDIIDMNDLEKQFLNEVLHMIEECKKLRYTPSRLIEMLRMNNNDAVVTVKKLISKSGATEGFTKLCLLGRLDLTLESIVTNPKYSVLFTEEEIAECENKLKK